MAITEPFVDTGTTISTTEYSLSNDSTSIAAQTDDGIYQVFIDVNAMASGDVFDISVYEKAYAAATQRKCQTWRLTGAQSDPIFVTPPMVLIHGWDFTVKKISGTDRSIAWSIRKVA